jgi:hypothetical protein
MSDYRFQVNKKLESVKKEQEKEQEMRTAEFEKQLDTAKKTHESDMSTFRNHLEQTHAQTLAAMEKTHAQALAAMEKTHIQRIKQQYVEVTRAVSCPISMELFRDPVCLTDGSCFERDAIVAWFATSNKHPLAGIQVVNHTLTPVRALRDVADAVRVLE